MEKVRNKLCIWLLQLSVMLSKVEHKAGIKTDGCFRTYTRIKFNILNPTNEMIDIKDIAKGLAYKPHFSGFSPKFFSIAEHSLLVEKIVSEKNELDYEARLVALLHDASEAYTGDMIKPIKNLLPNFRVIEKRIQKAILRKYNLPESTMQEIKYADCLAQDWEADIFYGKFMNNKFLKFFPPDMAYQEFMNRFSWLVFKIKEQNKTR